MNDAAVLSQALFWSATVLFIARVEALLSLRKGFTVYVKVPAALG